MVADFLYRKTMPGSVFSQVRVEISTQSYSNFGLEVTGSSVPSGLVAGIADRACSPRMAVRPLRGFPGFTVLITVAPVLGCGVKFTLVLGHIGLLVVAARLVGSATCSTWIIAHAACLPRGPRFIRLGHATITEATQEPYHWRSAT